jgi:enoyl-CoA hydratase/carnithine racemase
LPVWPVSGNPARLHALSFVLLTKPRPPLSLITLNRPERMNAKAFDVMIPFRKAIEEVSHDNDTRVVVIIGLDIHMSGGSFAE